MDNLCHTLAGAALGKAGLADRTPYGMVTLMVAANLPDVDVAVFFTDILPVSFRRGWTHGVLAQVTLPIVLAVIVWAIGRWRPAPGRGQPALGPLLVLCYVGLYSHIFMDWLNSYGVRVLMPFSERWSTATRCISLTRGCTLLLASGGGGRAGGRCGINRNPSGRHASGLPSRRVTCW